MPALPPVPGVIQCRLQYTIGDKQAENVLYFQYGPTSPSNDLFVNEVAAAIDTYMAGANAIWGALTTYQQTIVTDLTSDTAPVGSGSTPTAGTRAGDALGANTAALISYFIGRRYKGGHPRTYLPWFTANDILTPQTWKAASVTAGLTAFTSLLDAVVGFSSGGFTVGNQCSVSYIYSIPVPGTRRPVPLVSTISVEALDVMLASQRRRDGRH